MAEKKTTYILSAEDRSRMAFESMQKSFRALDAMAGRLGFSLSAIFTIAGLKQFLDKNIEAERAANRLTAVINAQGHAAGFTRAQLDDMADSMAAATQFDDESIRNGQAELLKLGNIYGDVFARAIKLSTDLAASQDGELSPAIEAVGKALQNPVEGLKQLQSVIGKLDPAQRRMIRNMVEQGDVIGAQNRLLDILEGKIGGAAATMNTGYSKAWSDVKKSFNELIETAGKAGLVQTLIQGFFKIISDGLGDIKRMIESGDWYASLLFMLGGMWGEGASAKFDLTEQSSMAKHITDLMDQLQELEQQKKRSSTTITMVDDEGRGYGTGVDEQIESTRRELQKLQAEYDKVYGFIKPAATPKPGIGLTDEQEAYLKSLREELARVDMGPVSEKLLKAQDLGVLKQATPLILEIAGAIQQTRDEADRAAASLADWTASMQIVQGLRDATTQMQSDTEIARIGGTPAERTKWAEMARQDMEIRRQSIALTGEQRDTFIAAAKAAQLAWADAYNANYEATRSFAHGFRTAMGDVYDHATNTADQVHDLFTNAFKGMEDALVEFVKTGKLDFRSLADSIISHLIRMQIQASITAPLSVLLGGLSLFGGTGAASGGGYGGGYGGGSPIGKAAGGPVSAMSPYWVGEEGPELFVPRSSGAIVPHGKAGGGDIIINQTINAMHGANYQDVYAAASRAKEEAKAEIRREFWRGGPVKKLAR